METISTQNGDDKSPENGVKANDNLITVEEFCETYGGRAKGILVPYAARVYVIARYGGIKYATEYFEKKLNRKMSKRPVELLLAKIRRGEIVLSQREVWEEAKKHPFSARFFEREINAIDTHSPIDEEPASNKHPKKDPEAAGQGEGDGSYPTPKKLPSHADPVPLDAKQARIAALAAGLESKFDEEKSRRRFARR